MTEDQMKAHLMFDIHVLITQISIPKVTKLKIQQYFQLSHFFDTEK